MEALSRRDIMASKIQIKRGNKADLPILSDGEYGFCQDTSEIFIGNGGTNTKIYPTTSLDASSVTVEDIENIFESVNVEGVLSELGESILDILNGITTVGKASDANTVGGFTVAKNVPSNANFTDTVTTINSKTGAIIKSDIVALGIPAQDSVYTHPTTAGNKHIPTGGSVGQILKNTASGTATWQAESVTPIANNLTETTIGKALDATQGKALDNKIGILNGNLTNLEYSELSSTATNIDDEGIYANIEWKRKDLTLYAKSTLLGVSPNYNQIKIDYYNNLGTTIDKTITWNLAYDDNGFIYKKDVI